MSQSSSTGNLLQHNAGQGSIWICSSSRRACTTLAAWRGGGHLSAEPAAGWGTAITVTGAPHLRMSVQLHFHQEQSDQRWCSKQRLEHACNDMYDSMQSAEASACYVAHLCYFDSLQLEFTVKTGGFLDECVKCVDQVLDFGN